MLFSPSVVNVYKAAEDGDEIRFKREKSYFLFASTLFLGGPVKKDSHYANY